MQKLDHHRSTLSILRLGFARRSQTLASSRQEAESKWECTKCMQMRVLAQLVAARRQHGRTAHMVYVWSSTSYSPRCMSVGWTPSFACSTYTYRRTHAILYVKLLVYVYRIEFSPSHPRCTCHMSTGDKNVVKAIYFLVLLSTTQIREK